MQAKSVYKKPQIVRIKLQAGEAIMGNCQSTTLRNQLVKSSTTATCRKALTACKNPIS